MDEPMRIGRGDMDKDPTLDADFRTIVLDPLRVGAGDPPTLQDLAVQVARAIVERDAAWYAENLGITDGSEDDEAILALTRELILLPSMGQP
jgi:hypothetical protein